ncbi:MAG: hypothetical protein AAB610_00485 [Patescibacteria group bacterium]
MTSTLTPIKMRFPEQRYSISNPPIDRDEGERRIDELEQSIILTEADLRTKDVSDFGTPDALHEWRIRARRSIGHRNHELRTLRKWLRSQDPSGPTNPEVLAEFNAAISEFIAEHPYIAKRWKSESSESLVAETIKRREELLSLRGRYERFMSHLETERRRLQCSFFDLKEAKARVHRVIKNMEPELLELKATRRTIGSGPIPTGDPRLKIIEEQLSGLKRELKMESAQMTGWLFSLIAPRSLELGLKPDELELLTRIGEFVRLTSERRAIQFPHSK